VCWARSWRRRSTGQPSSIEPKWLSTLGQQVFKVCGDALAFGGRTPGGRGGLQSWESSSLVGVEPRAHRVVMAVSTLRNVGDAPALGVQYNSMTAFGELGPRTACLFPMGGLFRR
jgi:hypothetical protein